MITLKTKRQIKDSTVNRNRHRNEIFTVTPERLKEIQKAFTDQDKNFNEFLEIVKIEKVKAIEVKTRQPRKPKA